MSEAEDMESDSEMYLPASQIVECENDREAAASQTVSQETNSTATSQEAGQGKTTRQRKTKEKEPTAAGKKDPCIYCGKNCVKGCMQCTICALWSHMSCTGLSKEQSWACVPGFAFPRSWRFRHAGPRERDFF